MARCHVFVDIRTLLHSITLLFIHGLFHQSQYSLSMELRTTLSEPHRPSTKDRPYQQRITMHNNAQSPAEASETRTINPVTLTKVHESWNAALSLAPLSSIDVHKRIIWDLKIHHEKLHKPPLLTSQQIARLWHNLGLLHARLGDYKLAESYFRTSLKHDKDSVLGWYGLGIARFLYGDLKNSKTAFVRCLACFGFSRQAVGVKFHKDTGEGLGGGVEMEEWVGRGGVWRLEKERVVWNLNKTVHEMHWKKNGIPRPVTGKFGLNGIPMGVLFGPEFDVPLSESEAQVQRLKTLGMIPNDYETLQNGLSKEEKSKKQNLSKHRKTLTDAPPAPRPKLPLPLRSRIEPHRVLSDISEKTESTPTSQGRSTRAKTENWAQTSSSTVSPLERNPNHLGVVSEISISRPRPENPKYEDSAKTASRSVEPQQIFPLHEASQWHPSSREGIETSSFYHRSSIRPESSASQHNIFTPSDPPPPVPRRSSKRLNHVYRSALGFKFSRTQQASHDTQYLRDPLLDQHILEKVVDSDRVNTPPKSPTESDRNARTLDRGRTLPFPQAYSKPRHSSLSSVSSQRSDLFPIYLEVAKQAAQPTASKLPKYPSWWALSKEEIARLNADMYEHIAQLDADAGRLQPPRAHKVPPRRDSLRPPRHDSLRPPSTPPTPCSSVVRNRKPDPFAHQLPFGYNRFIEVTDPSESNDPISCPGRSISDEYCNFRNAIGRSCQDVGLSSRHESYDEHLDDDRTSPSNTTPTQPEGYYDLSHVRGRHTGPSFPAPDLKKLASPLSPTSISRTPTKCQPLPLPLSDIASSSNAPTKRRPPPLSLATTATSKDPPNRQELLPSSPFIISTQAKADATTSGTTANPGAASHQPTSSVRISVHPNEGTQTYCFSSSRLRESAHWFEDWFAKQGGVIYGRNFAQDMQELRAQQMSRKTAEERRAERALKAQQSAQQEEEERMEKAEGGLSPSGCLRPVVWSGVGGLVSRRAERVRVSRASDVIRWYEGM